MSPNFSCWGKFFPLSNGSDRVSVRCLFACSNATAHWVPFPLCISNLPVIRKGSNLQIKQTHCHVIAPVRCSRLCCCLLCFVLLHSASSLLLLWYYVPKTNSSKQFVCLRQTCDIRTDNEINVKPIWIEFFSKWKCHCEWARMSQWNAFFRMSIVHKIERHALTMCFAVWMFVVFGSIELDLLFILNDLTISIQSFE